MRTDNKIVKDFKEIKEDYKWNLDIFCKDDEKVSLIKQIIDTRLSVVDKTIILLYVDCQSYRKLGKRLGFSHMTCRNECMRIKKIILDEYKKLSAQ